MTKEGWHAMNGKKILWLSTGGTIASAPGPDGMVPQNSGAELQKMLPGLGGDYSVECRELFSLDSSNVQPYHWSLLAEAIGAAYNDYDGFVVTHGTDTMAYTASALHWMLRGLGKPVVVTGSQLPLADPRTDGRANILNAFSVACSGRPGVFVVFGSRVMRGVSVRKADTKDFNAFCSVNESPAADISAAGILWKRPAAEQTGAFRVMPVFDEKVLLLKLIPGFSPALIDYAVEQKYRAIVIEGFGSGGVPTRENSLLPALERALKAGLIVVCASQCGSGGVKLDLYEVGLLASRLGALSSGLLTTEAVCTKLMWALGSAKTQAEAKELFLEDQHGAAS